MSLKEEGYNQVVTYDIPTNMRTERGGKLIYGDFVRLSATGEAFFTTFGGVTVYYILLEIPSGGKLTRFCLIVVFIVL